MGNSIIALVSHPMIYFDAHAYLRNLPTRRSRSVEPSTYAPTLRWLASIKYTMLP